MATVDHQGLVLETCDRRTVEASLSPALRIVKELREVRELISPVAGKGLGQVRLPRGQQLVVEAQVVGGVLADEDVRPVVGDAHSAACGQGE